MNRGLLVLLPALLVAGIPKAQMPPGLDPQDVVRQARSSHSTTSPLDHSATGLDDGEFLIDTNTVYVPAYAMQWYPSVASDGTNFLVVWHDWRRDYPNYVYCARVSPAGIVLDPAGIAIAPSLEDFVATAVAFDGTNFLAVWEDWRNGTTADLYGARVSPTGTVLDPGGFAVSLSPENQYNPAVAYDGANYLVVWDDWRGGTRGTRVTPAGVVLDPDGIPISTTSSDLCNPGVATDGSNFMVVWQKYEDNHIYGTRVDPAGVVLDTEGIRISPNTEHQQSPAVAFDGTDFLVIWLGWGDQGHHDLHGARVTPGGVVLDTVGIAVAASACWDEPPAIAFADTTFMAVWWSCRARYEIFCARVTRAGVPLDPDGIVVSGGAYECPSRIASDGTNFFAVWVDDRSQEPFDIFGARVSEAGGVLDSAGFAVSTQARLQVTPAVSSDSTNFLVVWKEERNGNADIYGARVNPAGGILDPEGFAISTSSDTQSRPAVAFDGTNYLVVWEQYVDDHYCDIYGARVRPDGIVLDTDAIAISTAEHRQCSPELAFDGTDFLVTWQDTRDSFELYGARVSPAGVVLDPDGIAISRRIYDYETHAIGFDGANFLVVWIAAELYGARVSPAGVVLDPEGFGISTAMGRQRSPAIAFDGTNSFVAWGDRRNGVDYDLYGARVSPAGILIDTLGIAISTAARDQDHPAVEFDGTNLLVIWHDRRDDYARDLYGAFVSPGGSVFGSGAVVKAPGFQSGPALARGSCGQMFLAYQGWTGTVGGKTYNSDRIWGKMDPHPGVEEGRQPTAYSSQLGATIVRGVLRISSQLTADGSRPGIELLDASGRRVMKLKPGENDVSGLAPGVYFVREAQAQAVRKVVIQK
jgi:hypothetical protein